MKQGKENKGDGNISIKLESGKRNDANTNSVLRINEHKPRHLHPTKTIFRRFIPLVRPEQLESNNNRQFGFVRDYTAELTFSIFLVIILFFLGFILGYSFSLSRTSSVYDTQGTNGYTGGSISNTDTKTITTSSNSSVMNTNNDADTITNTVSG